MKTAVQKGRKTFGRFGATLLAAGLFQALRADAVVQVAQSVGSFFITTNAAGNRRVVFNLDPAGQVEVVPFAPDTARVRFHFIGLFDREEVALAKPFDSWPPFSCAFTDASPTNFLIETDHLLIEVVKSPEFQVHFKDKGGYDLLRDYHIEYDPDYNPLADPTYYPSSGAVTGTPLGYKLKAIKVMPADEAYFGLGEFAGPLNRRGREVQFWNQDAYGWGEFRTPMYLSLPFLYGVRPASGDRPAFTYGVFFNNTVRPVVKLWSGLGDTYSFEAGDDQLDYFFFGGGADHSMRTVLDRYMELTGRPCLLPKWAYGYHQSRHTYASQAAVTDIADQLRARDFPCDAIYLDIGAMQDNSLQLTFNGNFHDMPGLVNYCRSRGMELVPLVEPGLTTRDPMYAEARDLLHFIKAADGSTYVGHNFMGDLSWLDYSSTPSADWWVSKLTDYLGRYGFEAIWNDLNEPNENAMALDTLYWCDGRYGTDAGDMRRWHLYNKNAFSVYQAATSYRGQKTNKPARRPFVLTRAGWPGIQRYAVGWSGDNTSSFDQLRFSTSLGLSVMISGQPHFGHDVGGFLETPSPELLTRWTEAGCLQPLYRNHSSYDTPPQEPWVHGDYFAGINRQWIKFRYRLLPYLYALAHQSATNGRPMNAPTVLYFTADTNTFANNDCDYLVGDSLLIAPVYRNTERLRSVYLPAGATWYAWPRDEALAGGQWVAAPAGLAALPMFSRAGAIIPMGPVMDHVREFEADFLDVHIWPGGTNALELYEDDGLTTNYAAGGFALSAVTQESRGDAMRIAVGARAGGFEPAARSFYFVVHAAPQIAGVRLGGQLLPRRGSRDELGSLGSGWAYASDTRQLTVKAPDTGEAAVVEIAYDAADGDSDGMPDWWEQAHGLNPAAADASEDPDGDLRRNGDEFPAGGDPRVPDVFQSAWSRMTVAGTFNHWDETSCNMRRVGDHVWAAVLDLSGLSGIEFKFVGDDSWSVNWGDADPPGAALPAVGVADGDAANIILGGLASRWHTFRFNDQTREYSVRRSDETDSDGDVMPDGYELSRGLDPYARADGQHDEDRDGVPNAAEWLAGTDLLDEEAYFFVDARWPAEAAGVELRWNAVSGRHYRVLFTTNEPGDSVWESLVPHTNVTGEGTVSVSDTNPAPRRFYRLGVKYP